MRSHASVRLVALGSALLGLAAAASGAPPAAGAAEAPGAPAVSARPPLLLVAPEEILALPSDVPVGWGRVEISPDGPLIRVNSPGDQAVFEGPFPIRVEFLPGPKGHPVDIGSLRIEYKRAWGIDITDRIRPYVQGTVIDVAESELPSGRHTVEIQISDVEDNLSARVFTVIVRAPTKQESSELGAQ